MKKYLILLLVAAMSLSTNAQKTPYLTKSFSSENINSVMAKTSGGNISVTAVNPSESRVEVFRYPKRKSAE